MSSNQSYSFLGGVVNCSFPGYTTRTWEHTVPMTDFKLSMHYPGFLFSSIFYFGLGTSAYFCGRALLKLGRHIMTYFKSVSNAAKYLNPKSPSGATYSAVIYGAGTKAGRIYAHYLA